MNAAQPSPRASVQYCPGLAQRMRAIDWPACFGEPRPQPPYDRRAQIMTAWELFARQWELTEAERRVLLLPQALMHGGRIDG